MGADKTAIATPFGPERQELIRNPMCNSTADPAWTLPGGNQELHEFKKDDRMHVSPALFTRLAGKKGGQRCSNRPTHHGDPRSRCLYVSRLRSETVTPSMVSNLTKGRKRRD